MVGGMYMVGRWTFVGFMVQRLQIGWICGLKRGRRGNYCELKIEWLPSNKSRKYVFLCW